MRSGCNQLCVFMCGRRSGGVLATPTWSFECEEYLCIPKHVGGMNIGKISRRTSTLKNLDGGWEICNNVGQRCRVAYNKALRDCAFGYLWPHENISVGGAKGFITFVDDFSKKVWVYMVKSKRKLFERLKEVWTFEKTQLEHEIKVFKLMSGGHSILKDFEVFMIEHGIKVVRFITPEKTWSGRRFVLRTYDCLETLLMQWF